MATTWSEKPPPTIMEAKSRLSPQVGHAGISQGKGGTNALVQQVSGEYRPEVRQGQTRLIRQLPKGKLLHLLFRLLPGFLAEVGVPALDIEGVTERPFHLLFPGHAGPGGNGHRLGEPEALPSAFIIRHMIHQLIQSFPSMCAIGNFMQRKSPVFRRKRGYRFLSYYQPSGNLQGRGAEAPPQKKCLLIYRPTPAPARHSLRPERCTDRLFRSF